MARRLGRLNNAIGHLLLGSIVWLTAATLNAQIPSGFCVKVLLNDTHAEINRLAADDANVRDTAYQALLTIGVNAYDELSIARHSKNPEIAISCRRLLGEIDVQHLLNTASPVLEGYFSKSHSGRAKTIIRLGTLPVSESSESLTLVAKMEPDEFLSRCAAAELITSSQIISPDGYDSISNALGYSQRTGTTWIRGWLDHLRGSKPLTDSVQPWMCELIDRELETQAHPHLTMRLMTWYSEQLIRQGEVEQANEVVDQLVQVLPESSSLLIETVDWLLDKGYYDAVTEIAESRKERFETDPRLLYRLAELYLRQNNTELADQTAENAREQVGPEAIMHIQCALHLQHSSLLHWASLEFETVAFDEDVDVTVRIQGCGLYAEMLFQDDRPLRAAEILEEALALNQNGTGSIIPMQDDRDELVARKHYFMARHFLGQLDYERAKKELVTGIQLAPGNSDLLIALYQIPGTDSAWRADVETLITSALNEIQTDINELRSEMRTSQTISSLQKHDLATRLNRYAWIVTHSFGDSSRVSAYCREAMELSPRSASILNTNAHHHFNNGDWHQAVSYGQLAVAQQPANQQFKQSLARFRQAMAFAEATKVWR